MVYEFCWSGGLEGVKKRGRTREKPGGKRARVNRKGLALGGGCIVDGVHISLPAPLAAPPPTLFLTANDRSASGEAPCGKGEDSKPGTLGILAARRKQVVLCHRACPKVGKRCLL